MKKPGPFFEASPNNFYLDKLTYRYDDNTNDNLNHDAIEGNIDTKNKTKINENEVEGVDKANNGDVDQGNLLKGIVIWLAVARSVVQSPVRTLDSNFSNTFSLFQLLQIMLAIHRLPLRIFFWKFFFT